MSTLQAGFDSMWGRIEGKYVTREIECDCGTVFVQRKVSKQFIEKSLAPFGQALQKFLFLTPGGWLPVYCHRCERLDLAGKARNRKPRERAV